MPFPVPIFRFPGRFWIPLAVVGTVFWGWWLAAWASPWWLSLSLGLVLVYLLGVGTGGIIPASVYLSLWVAIAVAGDYFPSFWPMDLHYKYWAFTLIVLWAAGLGYIFLIAKHGTALKHYPRRQRRWWQGGTLASLVVAMQVGAWLYQIGWPLGANGS